VGTTGTDLPGRCSDTKSEHGVTPLIHHHWSYFSLLLGRRPAIFRSDP